MDAPSPHVKNARGEDFSKYKVDGSKRFLIEHGIQLSDGGKGKRKAELVELVDYHWREITPKFVGQKSLCSLSFT